MERLLTHTHTQRLKCMRVCVLHKITQKLRKRNENKRRSKKLTNTNTHTYTHTQWRTLTHTLTHTHTQLNLLGLREAFVKRTRFVSCSIWHTQTSSGHATAPHIPPLRRLSLPPLPVYAPLPGKLRLQLCLLPSPLPSPLLTILASIFEHFWRHSFLCFARDRARAVQRAEGMHKKKQKT